MVNVIIGENSVGKSVILEKKLNNFGKVDCANNMNIVDDNRRIDEEKLNTLRLLLPYNIIVNGGSSVAITDNIDLGSEYLNFLSDICSDKQYFIYDEPERGVKEKFKGEVYDVIEAIGYMFKECWITSHYPGVTAISRANFYEAIDKEHLRKVNVGEAIEILDTF